MRNALLASLTAILLVLSFPRFDAGILAWVALVPLLVALKGATLRASFLLAFLAGILFLMGVFYWINILKNFTPVHFLLLGIYLGAYYGAFGLLLNFISRRVRFDPVILAPLLWVSLEYLRSHAGFLGLPWALLGHTQYLNLPVLQTASVTGVYGISFLVVMVNAALAESVVFFLGGRKPSGQAGHGSVAMQVSLAFAGIGLATGYGYYVLSRLPMMEEIRVSVIQGNIPQDVKWDPVFKASSLVRHAALTKDAAANGSPALIVWPETAIPTSFPQDVAAFRTVTRSAVEANAFLVVGAAHRRKIYWGRKDKEKEQSRHNSAFLVSNRGVILRNYNKIHLLPFGEYLPLKDWFPWPRGIAMTAGDFVPGKEHTLFEVEGAPFGVVICWENLFPELFRKFVDRGARFMVNLTNEAWFGESTAPYQFLSMAVFRAAENRVALVRSANTGVSCIIGPTGEILGRVNRSGKDVFVEGHMTRAIPLLREKTLYTRHGDVFADACRVTATLLLGAALLSAVRSRTKSTPGT